MRKQIILVFILSFFCFFANISAETFQCEYKFNDDGTENYIFEYDITNGNLKNLSEKENKPKIAEYQYINHFYTDEIKAYIKNKCPVLFMTRNVETIYEFGAMNESGFASVSNYYDVTQYHFYSDSHIRQEDATCIPKKGNKCLENLFETSEYFVGTLTESDVNKDNTIVSICPVYMKSINKIKKSYNSYKNCSGKGCTKYLNEAKTEIDNLKKSCSNILDYRDVVIEGSEDDEGNLLKDECIDVCVNINEILLEIKEESGLLGTENGECGFSTRLASLGLNIMKWVKYIVPVFVIIFGIFDFIKAIGADKEDEMKKSQKKFITRLIAAALIFIIPFILEFVLDKFGFTEYIDGCEVIQELD